MKLLSGLLGCVLFLSFTSGCASRELRDRNADLEKFKANLEIQNADLRSRLDDVGGIKDIKSDIENLSVKLDDIGARLSRIEDSNTSIASKISRTPRTTRTTKTTNGISSGKGGKYILRITDVPNVAKNKKNIANYVAFLKRKGIPASSRVTGTWLIIEGGSFSSIKSAAARAFASKVKRLDYYGTRPFKGAYFRNK